MNLRRALLTIAAVLFPTFAWAQCVPPNAPAGSTGCKPTASSAAGTDYLDLYQPNLAPNSSHKITVDNLFNGRGAPDLSSPGPIGSVTPNTGAFTGLTVGGVPITPTPALTSPGPIGTVTPNIGVFSGITIPNSLYYARNFGSCAWDATHDVGPCIQAAIDAAGANVGGGTVVVPNGTWGLATPLRISTQNTSIAGTGFGMVMRTNVLANTPVSPVIFNWIGAPVPTGSPQNYMLTVAPTLSPGRILVGTNIHGIEFDCKSIAGCSGPLILSVRHAVMDYGTKEPAGVAYAGSVVTSGSQTIQVSSTAGIVVGQSAVGANIPDGLYVAQIVDSTNVKISGQVSGSATETVVFGGEGTRFDVVDQLPDSNDTQDIKVRYFGMNLNGAAGATAPLIMIGGSAVIGSGPGPVFHFGNTSAMDFEFISCISKNGVCFALNNSDHNLIRQFGDQKIGGTAPALVSNGSLSPNNGQARYNRFVYLSTDTNWVGTDTAGFTLASVGNMISYMDSNNGAVSPKVGVGATVCVSDAAQPAIGCYGQGGGILAQLPDSTVMGGNNRNGGQFVDLQQTRNSPTQIASGPWAVIGGGENNTASGLASTVPGGNGNIAIGIGSYASGVAANADLYGARCHSAGAVDSGRSSEVCDIPLNALSGANTTPVRLFSGAGPANNQNCVNTRIGGQGYNMAVKLTAVDSIDPTNQYFWTQPMTIQTRGFIPALNVVTPIGTPLVGGIGTTTGAAVTEAADTTQSCYDLRFTPPTGNTHIWRISATVTFERGD